MTEGINRRLIEGWIRRLDDPRLLHPAGFVNNDLDDRGPLL
jgi:hypothetical protein